MIVANLRLDFHAWRGPIIERERGAVEVLAVVEGKSEQPGCAEPVRIANPFAAERDAKLGSEVGPQPSARRIPFGRFAADVEIEVVEFGGEGDLILLEKLPAENERATL